MELKLTRTDRTEESTIGDLTVDGVWEAYILEDKDRGLRQDMSLEEIKLLKIHGKTCIPSGRYEVAITFSNKFQKYLPLLLNVPGYEGIRIHSGNVAANTEGCLLPGTFKNHDRVSDSRTAFKKLFDKMKAVEKKEKMFLTVE